MVTVYCCIIQIPRVKGQRSFSKNMILTHLVKDNNLNYHLYLHLVLIAFKCQTEVSSGSALVCLTSDARSKAQVVVVGWYGNFTSSVKMVNLLCRYLLLLRIKKHDIIAGNDRIICLHKYGGMWIFSFNEICYLPTRFARRGINK